MFSYMTASPVCITKAMVAMMNQVAFTDSRGQQQEFRV